ncbi:hypothetical protein JAAARDRAFT_194230 [Jaapia argillacea MUCL 33604]|uniref:histidine kinase n=1 Tax=Jaapia argillacea MUCL 33604 TaxID=933084 RepID=A0A067Q0N5_9AGAM|nr:hypothetical protein JAAARDRAFT_194230 [Jaapia argillacea MUCL 33604]
MPSPATLPLHRPYIDREITFDTTDHRQVWSRFWTGFGKKITQASTGAPSDGLGDVSDISPPVPAFLAAQQQAAAEDDGRDWVVDEIVVTGEDDLHTRLDSDKDTISHRSELRSGSAYRQAFAGSHCCERGLFGWWRIRVWPAVYSFFNPKFEDPDAELEFQKQLWYTTKPVSFYASLYLLLDFCLSLILNHSTTLYEKIVYYGGMSAFTLPVPFMVIMDVSRKRPVFFQTWLCITIWYCGISEVIQMKQCGFYTDQNHCHGKEPAVEINCAVLIVRIVYYITALPAMMMFIVSRRFYNFVAQVVVLVLLLAIVLPDQRIFSRNVISFVIFSIFIQGLHYSREMTDRRMYLLNTQLKIAYRGQQKAQVAESKAFQSKRRFASYIFHEVRVPLNTAMLAYQNLRTSNAFRDQHLQGHSVEVYALEVSLTMMQQVLDDVLDHQSQQAVIISSLYYKMTFAEMDTGRFDSSPQPFPLHLAITSMMGPIAVATMAKSLRLHVDLDDRVDRLRWDSRTPGHDGLWVVGDEIRLCQVLTNLASNAVKFTPNGGEVKVSTKLLAPLLDDKLDELESPTHRKQLNPLVNAYRNRQDTLVFRIEVQDTGPGIRPSDLLDSRLFQPYVQTKLGKMSGSGTGLGLAIVRQIVSLSGGRLGVQSCKGAGATFWVEFSYPIATAAAVEAARSTRSFLPTPPESLPTSQTSSVEPEKFPSSATSSGNNLALHLAPPGIPKLVTGPTESPTPPFRRVDSSLDLPSPSLVDARLRVLVVDDDPLTRTLMTRMLERLGCVVDTATDGRQFLDALISPLVGSVSPRSYDLISMDNQMPIMTGEEAVREFRSLGRTDLVVGVTGNALAEDQASYTRAGADRILTKPVMLKDLKALLQMALERRVLVGDEQKASEPSQTEPPRSESLLR